MDMGRALWELASGRCVFRHCWEDGGFIRLGGGLNAPFQRVHWTGQGWELEPWEPSDNDGAADDWEVAGPFEGSSQFCRDY
jgi:hypothetical protein